MSAHDKVARAVIKAAADNGKIIEVGFEALRELAIAPNAPQIQVDEMRLAYMAGAQHLFSSMMCVLDPGKEETEDDLARMAGIQSELAAWEETLRLRYGQADGSA